MCVMFSLIRREGRIFPPRIRIQQHGMVQTKNRALKYGNVRPDATLYRIYLSSYVRRISIPTLSLQCPQTDCQPYILQKKTKVETSARPKRRLVRYTGTFKKICQNSWKSRVFFKKMLFFQFLQMKSLPLFC